MNFKDLREYIRFLEEKGDLVRIKTPVNHELEITEIADRTIKSGGPALLFENVTGSDMPVLINTGSHDFWIYPNSIWQELDIGAFDKYNFEVRDDLFFINVKKL